MKMLSLLLQHLLDDHNANAYFAHREKNKTAKLLANSVTGRVFAFIFIGAGGLLASVSK
ncbi:hypothetical protein [Cognaticolwellia aestuarii]|uniref:hypothetical protein n=1 Tax=Cognaticolwellia aestuarii TaxID=329993 RepID=UPI0013019416|nr:hypothetical protein [Cognaticolwellia aestuarii]